MAYEFEEIRISQEIFYSLLVNHELREDSESKFYKAYVESEVVQNLVKSQGEAAGADIERYGSVIYLIPKEENYFLGYSRAELQKILCRSDATYRDYYLVQFVILVLLMEFYDGQGSSSKITEHIRVGKLQNSISERLREGTLKYSEEEQSSKGAAFSDMLQAYEALKSDESMNRRKTTKEGFIYKILEFLQDQGLIVYVKQDETVMTTQKLDHFMDWNLLNKSNYHRITAVIGGGDNEQN